MLRVMIVEDEDMIRKGLVFTIDWLSMDCVVVAEASNGQEGYERILEYKIGRASCRERVSSPV